MIELIIALSALHTLAYCDYYKNNTLFFVKDEICKFDPEVYSYSISHRVSFNFLNTSKELTVFLDDSKDVDFVLGLDSMKTMIPRKQYFSSLEKLNVYGSGVQEPHTLTLMALEIQKDFELNVYTPNTTIRVSKNDMEYPITYKITSVDGNKVVFVRGVTSPADHVILVGNVSVAWQNSNSKHRESCEITFVSEGKVSTTPFKFSVYGVVQEAEKLNALCERKGYTRFTDCNDEEFQTNVLQHETDNLCSCKFLWSDERGVHYNKWDCDIYSQYLDLIAYLPNAVITGNWSGITVRNTNASFVNEHAKWVVLNNTIIKGSVIAEKVKVLRNVFADNVEAKDIYIEGILFVKTAKLGVQFKFGKEENGYKEVILYNKEKKEL
ncbi:hypothetical protein EIN_381450 [Entamoeba invadens IP1]|uniref:Uncharacterized protein n=1 Tax=Entamoeba invadens IP1 TaxID=370355 RepID=A0A0A1UAS1_ENTIV|nr:hypothetical protein EIN_381450 [Entamoeba invadens IP1]ELP92178.1 hypothetical protein EIN_381450 [Entamoeba invadens IP1]|eukprot:XP_004258949.1 hypothetical protein EIN_381450 [Entamoeba invadens IP1]